MDTPHSNSLDNLLIQNAEAGNLDAVTSLIAKGANINAFNDLHENVLMCAIRQRKIKVAIWLIERGADWVTSNAIGYTAIDYINDYNDFELLQSIIHRQDFKSKCFFNHPKIGQIFYHVVSLGFVDIIDYFIKYYPNWRTIKDMHGRDVIDSTIVHANLRQNKETKGIYRLLSEMTLEERQEMLEWQESPSFHTFILSFEQILKCCDKNVSRFKDEGSLNIFVLNHRLPKDLAALVAIKWFNICSSGEQAIPVWYLHQIEKDFEAKYKKEDAMQIEEATKPRALLFSQESQPVIRKNSIKKQKQNDSMDIDDDVAKHSGCFSFGKTKPKCSIQ